MQYAKGFRGVYINCYHRKRCFSSKCTINRFAPKLRSETRWEAYRASTEPLAGLRVCGREKQWLLSPISGIEIGRNFPQFWALVPPFSDLSFPLYFGLLPPLRRKFC